MIIKPMAITRCPYCHAITDENDKYCNNCGTQLLFTEDEAIEEEIPGEKIIDAEVEEKDYTVEEPEGEKRPAPAKDLDSEIDEELEEEIPEETEEMNLEELVDEEISEEAAKRDATEEVILVDEIEASEAKGPEDSRPLDEEEPAGLKKEKPEDLKEDNEEEDRKDEDEEEDEEEDQDEDDDEEGEEDRDEDEGTDKLTDEFEQEEEIEKEAKEERGQETAPVGKTGAEDDTREYTVVPVPDTTIPEAPEPVPVSTDEHEVEYVSTAEGPDEAATPGEAGLAPATFDTQELEDLGKTVDLSGEKVDKFFDVMAGQAAVTPAGPLEPPVQAPLPGKPSEPSTGSLPPWASTMKGAPVFPEDTGPVETRKFRGGEPATPDTDEEVEIFPRRRAPDSSIGLPEQVSQAPLPFGTPATATEEADEEPAEAAEGEEEGIPTPEPAVLPAGEVRHVREPILPVREPETAVSSERRGIETAAEIEEPEPRPPFSFSVFIKSKTFDILFVGLFWLVALWLAASSMGMTLFDILGSMSGSMLMLYGVFVFLYFFLFKFFLGETLGDRLFRPRE